MNLQYQTKMLTLQVNLERQLTPLIGKERAKEEAEKICKRINKINKESKDG